MFDQSADTNYVKFHRYAKTYHLPEYVKTAEVANIGLPVPGEFARELPVSSFADPRGKGRFPCHTKAATFVSWLYWLNHKADFPEKIAHLIENGLRAKAAYWNISVDVDQLEKEHAKLHKESETDETDDDFALVESDYGRKTRQYPLRNALEVKAAAAWFSKYRDNFTFPVRQQIAKAILTKAAKFGAAISEHSDWLEKQAGYGFCKPAEVSQFIKDRIVIGSATGELKQQMLKLAEQVETKSSIMLDHDTLSGIAKTVDMFDYAQNIKVGDNRAPRIEDVLFNVTYKEARDFTLHACRTQSGKTYDRRDFEKVSIADLTELFGDEFVSQVTTGLAIDPVKFAEVASTLPRPDAQLLDQMLQDSGIQAIVKQNQADSFADNQFLQELSELYD